MTLLLRRPASQSKTRILECIAINIGSQTFSSAPVAPPQLLALGLTVFHFSWHHGQQVFRCPPVRSEQDRIVALSPCPKGFLCFGETFSNTS